jgi:serine O-acetyltransferase
MRKLNISIPETHLVDLVNSQLNYHFPDHQEICIQTLQNSVKSALYRIRKCFDSIVLKYYGYGEESYFSHLHGDQYSMFLYLLSNEVYLANDEILAAKIFLLNKSLFGIDAFYSIKLPDHFLFVHPLGTVLGNANYGDFFVVYQGVTVGSTTQGIYPTFSTSTILYSSSSIIGNCHTSENFVLGANASLINSNIPANKIVVGNYPNHSILENKNKLISNYFKS